MEQGREKWPDPRIDDLKDGVKDLGARMDARFEKVEADFRVVNARMDAGFGRVDARFEKVDEDFQTMNARMDAGFARSYDRFDALQRTLMLIGGGIVAALIAMIATILGVALTQL